jgi:cytochrome c oxidase subunit II
MNDFNDWFAFKVLVLPERAATGAKAIDDLIVIVHYLMLALFLGWVAYFLYTLWRFNAKRNAQASYEGSKSALPKYTEIAIVAFEAYLLLWLAIPMWGKNVEKFPEAKDSTLVQVVAEQFRWNARYAGPDGTFGQQDMKRVAENNVFGVDPADPASKDDLQLVNEIHVPVGKPVIIYLSSRDVIHSLKLIAMRTTQDAIPGLRIPFSFTPTKIGRFQIVCAQLCGGGHAAMAGGFVIVQSAEDYQAWFAAQTAPAPVVANK